MADLTLRGGGGSLVLNGGGATLRLGHNGGTTSLAMILGVGPAGAASTIPGPPGPALPADQIAALDGKYAPQRVKDVKTLGAKGDGTTDDTAALQAVLNGIVPGDVIRIPQGNYKHDHLTISNKSGFTIIGEGAKLLATSHTVQYLRFDTCTDFTVRGVASIGNSPVARQGTTRGFSFEHCDRYLVTGCEAAFTEGIGIYSEFCTEARIVDNYVHDTKADGIGVYRASKGFTVTGNVLRENGDDAIAVVGFLTSGSPCENVSIAGNTISNGYSRGILVSGVNGCSVSGNTIKDTKNAGIYVARDTAFSTYPAVGVAVTGNTVTRPNTFASPVSVYAGISVLGSDITSPVKDITISGNVVEDAANAGITIGSGAGPGVYDVVVSNNIVRNSGLYGIQTQAVTGLVCNGNIVDTCTSTGIWLTGSLGVLVVIGNSVTNPNTVTTNGYGYRLNTPGNTQGIAGGNALTDSGVNTATRFFTAGNWSLFANDGASLPTSPNVQVFTTSGAYTWTKPGGVSTVRCDLLGGGGGGGSGRKGAAATIRCGGGGGGGGGYVSQVLRAADLGATVGGSVGAGGNGGAAQATDSTDGSAGTAGASTYFGVSGGIYYARAIGGSAGAGGTATTGTGGGGGAGINNGGAGAAASTTGLVGVSGGSAPAPGGGSGGGITSANVESAGGNGGTGNMAANVGGTGGTAAGGAGGAGTAPLTPNAAIGGGGGAGGGGSATGSGGSGGTGATAAGGGGGGAGLNGQTGSGAGGAGGTGVAVITSW